MKKPLALVAIALFFWWVVTKYFPSNDGVPVASTNLQYSIAELLADDEGFSDTKRPWRFQFPRDHGAHPNYKTESWYLTGQLSTASGRQFGFQWTLFRIGLIAPGTLQRNSGKIKSSKKRSAWAADSVYRGHLALTDAAQEQFHSTERFSRAALGLSGSCLAPVRVWLEDWAVEFSDEPDPAPLFTVRAQDKDIGITLNLSALKPTILSGGNDFATASFYSYLYSRLQGQGTIRIGQETFQVEGLAWLDRAWGWVPVPAGPIVWDRFLAQLDDGSEVMGLRLRRRKGGGQPVSTAMRIDPEGSVQRFGQEDVSIAVLDHWESPHQQTRYPAHWQIKILPLNLTLDIRPRIADQALDLSLRYWAGMIDISATQRDKTVKGQGFAELTGYADG